MRLNLCIDIDGTITEPFYWLQLANQYFKTNITEDKVTKYDIHEVLGVSRAEYDLFYNIYCEELHVKANVREGAVKILNMLNHRHNINYVTAREPRLAKVTAKWLQMNDLPTGCLYVLGSHYKVNKARELNCHIFIEDRYENAIQLALAGFKVLLIDCSYNRQPLIYGITRVYNWEDINKEIQIYYNSLIDRKSQVIA